MAAKLFELKTYNFAEWLPFIRLLSIPLLLTLVFLNERYAAALVFLLSFCTDALDGFIGRTFKMHTRRLQKLDSIADMNLLGSGLFAFVYFEYGFVSDHLLSLSGVLSLYLTQALYALLRYGKTSSFHTLAARFAAVVQTAFITYALFYEPKPGFFYFTLAVSLFETCEEIILIALHPRYPGQIHSLLYTLYQRYAARQY